MQTKKIKKEKQKMQKKQKRKKNGNIIKKKEKYVKK